MSEIYLIKDISDKGKIKSSQLISSYRMELNKELGDIISISNIDYVVLEIKDLFGSNQVVGHQYYVEEFSK